MFSKIVKLALSLSVVSCSYFFDKTEKEAEPYDLTFSEKSSVNCVEKNGDLLRDYFDLKRSNEEMVVELRSMKTCLNDAIKLFVKHTKGVDANSYTPSEIHHFLRRLFEAYTYEEQLLIDVTAFKESLLGGAKDVVTKEEIRKLTQYIDFFYVSLAELAPYRHMLFSKRTGDSWTDFAVAAQQLETVAAKFKNLPNKTTGTFDYTALVKVAEVLIDDPDSHWSKTFDLINSIQSALVKGQRDTLRIQDVAPLVERLAPLYLSYMEFHKFIRDNAHCADDDEDCLQEGFFKDLASVFIFPALVTRLVDRPLAYDGKVDILLSAQTRVLKTLKSSFEATGGVTLDYVYDLVATLSRIEALPELIKPSTLNQMAPQFFGFFLGNERCGSRLNVNCEDTVVGVAQANDLIALYQDWAERQHWINDEISNKSNQHTFTRQDLRRKVRRSTAISANVIDLQESLDRVDHAHWSNYVHIGSSDLNYKDLVIFNNLFTLIKLFLKPFNGNAQESEVLNYFLRQSQVQFFYEWFRPLGLELKLIDQRSRSSGEQAFIEINLFGSQSVKADQMDFTELIEYFQIALSTGARTDYLLKQKFEDCTLSGNIDVFEYEKREAHCFREEYKSQARDYFFSTMPKFKNYYDSIVIVNQPRQAIQPHPYNTMLMRLEKAGRQGVIANTPFDGDAVRIMSSIAQYAESFFLRFEDPNDGDELIKGEELRRALEHIVPNLKILINDSLEADEVARLYKFFPNFEIDLITYTLYYSETPMILEAVTTAEQLRGVVQLRTFVNGFANWVNGEAEVKREDVMAVIKGLSAFARTSKVKTLRKIFSDNEINFKNKSYTDPSHPVFDQIAAALSCSTLRDSDIKLWLVENQDLYFKDALQYFELNVGGSIWSLSRNDIPQTGVFAGWQGAVVEKLVTTLAQDPLGRLCGLPYLKDIHEIVDDESCVRRVPIPNNPRQVRACEPY